MYQRLSPDFTGLVARVASDFPAEWNAARKRPDGSRDLAFIRRLAWIAHQRDPNIGLNGKRGGDEISGDALAYKNDSAPGGAEVIDVIVGSTHSPAWQDVTIAPGMRPDLPDGVLGRFIMPTDPGGIIMVPPGTQPVDITAPDVAALRREVAELKELLKGAVKIGDKIALKASEGKYLCAEGGGPREDYQPFWLRSRSAIGGWESWTVDKGQ